MNKTKKYSPARTFTSGIVIQRHELLRQTWGRQIDGHRTWQATICQHFSFEIPEIKIVRDCQLY